MHAGPPLPRLAGPFLVALAVLFPLAGCDLPRAHGETHAVIVTSDAELWESMEQQVEAAIAPRIQVVRDEATFRVTWQDPDDASNWSHLQKFRNIVTIGAPGDAWVDAALGARRSDAPPVAAGEIFQVDNVWATGQTVTVVLLPSTRDETALSGMLEPLGASLDRLYREFALNRMFISGTNTHLADSLATHVGFRLELPEVYRYSVLDSVFRFRNDNPSPADLIREIGVTWVSPIPEADPLPAEIAQWRSDFTATYYNDPQVVDTVVTTLRTVSVEGGDSEGIEWQAAWASPPDAWPAGGPTLTRLMPCPGQDRLYYLDAWVYAPSRAKYEYLIQLETILDSFRCG
jgi:hypothetical protein